MKVALYARVSSEEQVSGTSLDTQLAELRRTVEYKHWNVYREYIDGGYSGTIDDRPEFNRLMQDANNKSFDAVVVYRLDRFMRNLRLLLNRVGELEKKGISFVSVGEGFDTSNHQGKFTLNILGVVAEFEHQRILERTSDGRKKRLAEGEMTSDVSPGLALNQRP
jgi:site-specific DNA recombinase